VFLFLWVKQIFFDSIYKIDVGKHVFFFNSTNIIEKYSIKKACILFFLHANESLKELKNKQILKSNNINGASSWATGPNQIMSTENDKHVVCRINDRSAWVWFDVKIG
jgi:hypothetical protein